MSTETNGHWRPSPWEEPISVVATQLALAWFMIPWIKQRKMNSDIDLQDMACMRRKRPRGNSKRKERKNRVKKVSGAAKANVGAGKERGGDWTTGVKIRQWLSVNVSSMGWGTGYVLLTIESSTQYLAHGRASINIGWKSNEWSCCKCPGKRWYTAELCSDKFHVLFRR